MFSQVPVYLGRGGEQILVGHAEIIDHKEVIIHFSRETMIRAIVDLGELDQIRGIYVDLAYIPTPREASPDATA